MPIYEKSLTTEYKGLQLHAEHLTPASGWHDQGSPDHFYGFPKSKGLWVAEIEPACRCPHAPVRLFLTVRVDGQNRMRRISTAVHQVMPWGAFEELEMPLFDIDMATARTALEGALTAAARAELRWRRTPERERPVALLDLLPLVGAKVSAAPVKKLISRFNLAKNTALGGEGLDYSAPNQPIELHADYSGKLTTVHFHPRPADVLDVSAGEVLSRDAVRARLGDPTDRLASGDRYAEGGRVSVFEYDAAGAVTLATVMSAEVAP